MPKNTVFLLLRIFLRIAHQRVVDRGSSPVFGLLYARTTRGGRGRLRYAASMIIARTIGKVREVYYNGVVLFEEHLMVTQSNSNQTERIDHGIEKLLGALELAIMRIVWARDTVTVREVLDALTQTRPLAYTTVMTIMSRLADKGLLATTRQGKTYQYRAALTPEALKAQAVGRAVQTMLADFGGEIAIRQFVEQLAAVDPAQLHRLAEMAKLAQEEDDAA